MKYASVLLAITCLLSAVKAQWLETTIQLPDSSEPIALCYNPLDNKVYCVNYGSDDVTVIDGATNQVIATSSAGDGPYALCYNPLDNKVYCANYGSGDVTVIDGASNQVLTTIGVGVEPVAFCHNPQQNRIYVANYWSSSISVLRDSAGGIEEVANGERRMANSGPSVLRSLPPGAVAFDAMGRRVASAKAGIYFLRSTAGGKPLMTRKAIIQK